MATKQMYIQMNVFINVKSDKTPVSVFFNGGLRLSLDHLNFYPFKGAVYKMNFTASSHCAVPAYTPLQTCQPHTPFPLARQPPHPLLQATLCNECAMFSLRGILGSPYSTPY